VITVRDDRGSGKDMSLTISATAAVGAVTPAHRVPVG
jgi:hypothetical protein